MIKNKLIILIIFEFIACFVISKKNEIKIGILPSFKDVDVDCISSVIQLAIDHTNEYASS